MGTVPNEKLRPTRRIGALRELWPFLKPHRWLAVSWLLFLALSSGASLMLPLAFRHIIEKGFGHSSLDVINTTFIALFGVAVVLAITTAARYFCITLLSERALASLRQTLYAHLIRLDVGFFEKSVDRPRCFGSAAQRRDAGWRRGGDGFDRTFVSRTHRTGNSNSDVAYPIDRSARAATFSRQPRSPR